MQQLKSDRIRATQLAQLIVCLWIILFLLIWFPHTALSQNTFTVTMKDGKRAAKETLENGIVVWDTGQVMQFERIRMPFRDADAIWLDYYGGGGRGASLRKITEIREAPPVPPLPDLKSLDVPEDAPPKVRSYLRDLLSDGALQRGRAAHLLATENAEGAIPFLIATLSDNAGLMWKSTAPTAIGRPTTPGELAALALAAIGEPAVKSLSLAARHPIPRVSRNAATALGKIASKDALESLFSLMKDGYQVPTKAFVYAGNRAVPKLLDLVEDPRPYVQGCALNSLENIFEQCDDA